jgi:hypothetical protein
VPVDCRIQLNDTGVAEQPNTQKQALCDPHGSTPVRQTQSASGRVAPYSNSLSKASVENLLWSRKSNSVEDGKAIPNFAKSGKRDTGKVDRAESQCPVTRI